MYDKTLTKLQEILDSKYATPNIITDLTITYTPPDGVGQITFNNNGEEMQTTFTENAEGVVEIDENIVTSNIEKEADNISPANMPVEDSVKDSESETAQEVPAEPAPLETAAETASIKDENLSDKSLTSNQVNLDENKLSNEEKTTDSTQNITKQEVTDIVTNAVSQVEKNILEAIKAVIPQVQDSVQDSLENSYTNLKPIEVLTKKYGAVAANKVNILNNTKKFSSNFKK